MRLVIYLPLVVSVLAAVAGRPLAERLPPRTAAWLLTGAAVVLAAATGAGLGLLALIAAGLLLAAAAAAAIRAAWLRTAALAAAHRQARCLPGTGQVVVLADEAADAYAAPGWPGRIV